MSGDFLRGQGPGVSDVGRESAAHPAFSRLAHKVCLVTEMDAKLSLACKCVRKLSLGTRKRD